MPSQQLLTARLACLVVAFTGCGPNQSTIVDQAAAAHVTQIPKADASAGALDTPQSQSGEVSPWPLVVGGPQGIVAVDENGRVVRRYTSTPAEAVRSAPDGSLWFLSPRAAGLELRKLTPTGEQRVVATMPKHFDREQCAPSASSDGAELYLHEATDFVVSNASICVLLSDRNVNMRSLSVATTIDRDSRVHTSAVYAPECGRDADVPSCDDPRATAPRATVPKARPNTLHQYRYDEATGVVLRNADGTHAFTLIVEEQQTGHELAASPSGSLVLIGVFQGEGDYFHWTPVALDLRTGFVVGFQNDNDSVIALPYPEGLIDESQTTWLDIVTETEAFFVDDRGAVIDGLLISFPEEALTPQTLPHAITLPGHPVPRL